ncbi:MAG: DUF4430 domain-containing protein [Oscillospiraceae bacterium]|nr:DUF4430 domain-containing protein [Oscillospiraceae bacterium]
MKKRLGGVMQTAMAILLCMAAVLCVTRLQTGHAPREDARAASRMLYSPGEVLYDGDRVTAMDSANDAEVPEDETPPDQPDAPESPQPDDTPTPDAPPVDSDTASSDGRDGIGDLLDIADNGGGSGGQTPDHAAPGDVTVPEAPDAALYFTTSIIDGETTAEETYPFTITHQPQREPIGLAVTVNGRELRYAAQTTSVTVHLAAGANTIVVSADYREDGGTVRATRSYTVCYAQPGELIIVAKRTSDGRQLGELGTVSEGALTFTAYAERDGSTYPVQSVELNGRTLAGSGGSYTADLNSGENRIRVKASYQSSTADVTYTITYNANAFRIETSISDTVIDDNTAQSSASFEKVTVDSQQYKFRLNLFRSTGRETIDRVRVSDSTGTFSLTQDSDERYTVQMGREDRQLYIDYRDSTGRSRTYKYLLHFQRGAEGTPEDRQPTIIAQVEADGTVIGLTNGLTMKTPDLIVLVDGRSYNGQQLYANNYTVSVNGTVVSAPISQSGYQFGYTAYLSNVGANTITITATDGDGYSATRSWTVYYENGDITVTVSVEATTVGLGYLVPPTEVTVPGGTDAWSIVEKVLTENGYGTSGSGSYLSAIQRSGICSGFFIDSELMELIMADGMDENGAGLDPQPFSMDSLGEFDFYRWSGWMYSYNGSYPGYGLNVCKPQDGSVIRVRYTLALGKDIGGYSSANGNYGVSSGNYYKEW